MKLDKETELKVIDKTKTLALDWKGHWDKAYDGIFKDYRRMADGLLDLATEKRLNAKEFEWNSKLVPRVIPNIIDYLKSTIINSTFNRDTIFELIGRRKNDDMRADDASDLLSYEFDVMGVRDISEQILEDSLEVGIGYGETAIHKERALTPRFEDAEETPGRQKFNRENVEMIYTGPRLSFKPVEMIYPDPSAYNINDRNFRGYAEYLELPISAIIEEGMTGGMYEEYAKNISEIKPGDFNPAIRAQYQRSKDHEGSEAIVYDKDDDFPVLALQMWRRIAIFEKEIPKWHLIVIANAYTNPQLLRLDVDPLKTNHHPLVACRVFPKNRRLVGKCAAEKLKDYMLEKYHGKNKVIDISNDISEFAGMMFVPEGMFDKNSMAVKRRKVVKTMAMSSEIKTINLDSSPIPHLMNREDRIDREIQETMATNPITLGQTPSRKETATAIATVNENAQIRANSPIRSFENTLLVPVAKNFLLLSQLMMPEDFVIRILGKDNAWDYKSMSKADILGQFDIKCYGSSEVLTKGVKLALLEKSFQVFGMNPHVRIDWQGMAKKYYKLAEIGGVDKLIPELTWDEADADRENGALLGGVVWKAIESDNHDIHIIKHLEAKEMASQILAMAQQEGQPDVVQKLTVIVSNIEQHSRQHEQFRQIINGQMNVGAGSQLPIAENTGELMRDTNSDLNPEMMGNG